MDRLRTIRYSGSFKPRLNRVLIVGTVFSFGIAASLLNTANAAVAHVATTTGNNGAGTNSLVINHPSTGSIGSVMIAAIGVRGGSGVTITATGWTQINTANTTTATTMKGSTYYRVIAAGDPASFTFNLSGVQKATGVIAAYSGVDASDPVNVQTVVANASATAMTATGATTTVANGMVIAAYSTATGGTVTAGSSMALRGQDTGSGGNANTRTITGIQDVLQPAATATGNKTMTAGVAALSVGHLIVLRPDPVISQAKFRFFANTDSTTASTPLAAIDTAASISRQAGFRLRLNLGLASGGTNMTAVAGRTYKLQYAARGVDNTCDTSFSGETYADISTSTEVQFLNNPTPADGATYVASANDPTRGLTDVLQYYEEAAPMGMRLAVAANQDSYWDIALNTSATAVEGGYYCLRAVNGNGTTLSGTYSVIPQVYIQPPSVTQANYRWYPNADSAAPGTPTVAQDAVTTVTPASQFRLRQRLAVDNAQIASSGASYKLQYAEKAGTCSASFGGTVDYVNAPSVTSQTKIAGTAVNVSQGGIAWQTPSNATAQDGASANAIGNNVGPGPTDILRTTNYGFTVPTNATITGVVVNGGGAVGAPATDNSTTLIAGGSANRATGTTPWDGTMIWGNSTDMWGSALTPAIINSSSFGSDIVGSLPFDSGMGLDYVSITVYYTATVNGAIQFLR